ncbi:hypothetical protein X566_16395 [Afipia sp. P52-10]|nr:hypothetical protein X566_16395 [Afipia sp. P52-10]
MSGRAMLTPNCDGDSYVIVREMRAAAGVATFASCGGNGVGEWWHQAQTASAERHSRFGIRIERLRRDADVRLAGLPRFDFP